MHPPHLILFLFSTSVNHFYCGKYVKFRHTVRFFPPSFFWCGVNARNAHWKWVFIHTHTNAHYLTMAQMSLVQKHIHTHMRQKQLNNTHFGFPLNWHHHHSIFSDLFQWTFYLWLNCNGFSLSFKRTFIGHPAKAFLPKCCWRSY